jgi:hypothetical protein
MLRWKAIDCASKPLPSRFFKCLWESCDITYGDFCDALGNGVAKRLEVAAVKVFQHTQPPSLEVFMQLSCKAKNTKGGPQDG